MTDVDDQLDQGTEVTIQVHGDRRLWSELRQPWQELQATVAEANVFVTWQWQHSWWDVLGGSDELYVLTFADSAGRLVGLAPLCLHRVDGGSKVVQFIGGLEVTDHLGLLVQPGWWLAVGRALIDLWMSQSPGELDLHFLPENSMTLASLLAACERINLEAKVVPEEVSPRVQLPAGFDEYLARLDRKDRHELRRKLRRLESANPNFSSVGMDGLSSALEEFFRLHRASSRAKHDFLDEPMMAFFRRSARVLLEAGWLRLRLLEVDGHNVASIMGFDYRDKVYLYNSGYDPTVGHLSAGLMLIVHDLADAIAQGRREYDFLRGSEEYKYDLGGKDVPLYRFSVRV